MNNGMVFSKRMFVNYVTNQTPNPFWEFICFYIIPVISFCTRSSFLFSTAKVIIWSEHFLDMIQFE